MSNTYTKIYLHLVFAVKQRECMISPHIQQRLHLYFASILTQAGHYPVAIGGTDDHIHLLIDYKPTQPIPNMVRELKVASAKLINTHYMIPFSFSWQRGYGCFSYAPSQIENVKNYVLNQSTHHKKMTLREEMIMIYNRFGIEYDPQYIFDD